MRHATVLAVPSTLALMVAGATAALAVPAADSSEGEPGEYSLSLEGLNNSGASGSALLTLGDDGSLTVEIDAQGLAAGQPHAQHLHGDADLTKDFVCPTPDDDTDGDGFVSTAEGVPAYGGVHISLTTEGDTSPDSGLAVDRFPVADDDGNLTYSRTLAADELPQGTAAAIRNLHVVQHGIDINGNGEYDADNGPSSLDPELPLEATIPASCGLVTGANVADVPEGGVDTGVGPLSDSNTQAASSGGVWAASLAAALLVAVAALWLKLPRARVKRS